MLQHSSVAWNARTGREQVENTSSLEWYGEDKPSVYLCIFSWRCLSAVRRERLCTAVHIQSRLTVYQCGLKSKNDSVLSCLYHKWSDKEHSDASLLFFKT